MGIFINSHHPISALQQSFRHLPGHGQLVNHEGNAPLLQSLNRFWRHRTHIAAAAMDVQAGGAGLQPIAQPALLSLGVEPFLGKTAAEVIAGAEKENASHRLGKSNGNANAQSLLPRHAQLQQEQR